MKEYSDKHKKISVKSWMGNLLLLILSSVISLIAAEIYFRMTSPYIIRKGTTGDAGKEVKGDYSYFMDTISGRRLIPNTHVIRVYGDRKIKIDINSNGFRGEEIPDLKKPYETRILVLGDSITFGPYTPKNYTYVELAKAYLREASRQREIGFINGGVEGIGTKDELDILVDQGLAVSPDVVVVGFYLNDANPPDRLAAGLANPGFVRRHSVLAQTIYRAYKSQQYRKEKMKEANMYAWLNIPPPPDLRKNRSSLLYYAAVAEKDWGAAWNPNSWTGIDEQMKRLQLLSQKYNFRVVVLAFPVSFQVDTEYVEDGPQQRIGLLARKYNFYFLDLLPVFRSSIDKRPLFEDWCHLTIYGHDLVGKTLAGYLSENVLH